MIPLTSVLYALAREFTDRRLAERNIPLEKLEIQPPDIKSRSDDRKALVKTEKLQRALKRIQFQNKKKKEE